MTADDDQTREHVLAAAARLTAASAELARMTRRKEFERELRERGGWLVRGGAAPPAWVREWNEYWKRLETDPRHQELQRERAEAHAALHSQEFEAAIGGLRAGEARGADYAVAYVEADPWYFRSGYLKASLLRWLRQVPLTERQQARLRVAILASIQKGNRLEFGETRKMARRLHSPAFREAVEEFLEHPDSGTRERAALLLESCRLNETRGDLRGAR